MKDRKRYVRNMKKEDKRESKSTKFFQESRVLSDIKPKNCEVFKGKSERTSGRRLNKELL